MQQQAITETGVLKIPSDLEIMLLDNSITDSDISDCVTAHNAEWFNPERGRFFELTSRIQRQRLDSGELMIGVRVQGRLISYVETMSHYVEIPDMPTDPDKPDIETALRIANSMSKELKGNYFKHAPGGEWPQRPENANVIRFVSINTIPNYRDAGYGGQVIEYIKLSMRRPREERPKQLQDVVVGLTDTPPKKLPQRFHSEYGAQNTGYREQGFRPGYDEPDIIRFCYFAPGFQAPLGRIRPA